MSALYDIFDHSGQYAFAAGKLMECDTDEEYGEALDEALKLFDQAREDMQADAGVIARIYRNLKAKQAIQEAEAAVHKQEYDRHNARAKATGKAAERYKSAVCAAMEMNGLQKIRTDIGTWFIKDEVKVEVLDPYVIPDEFVNAQPPKPDLNAIKKHFKITGELIPGVEITPTKGAQFR